MKEEIKHQPLPTHDAGAAAAITPLRFPREIVAWFTDVILMDINLPDTSGIEAMAILCKVQESAHIPIIFPGAMPLDIGKGLEDGFRRYLTNQSGLSIS